MNILLPISITEAMIGAGTNIPAVDADRGEVAWDPASHAYSIDDAVVFEGKIYSCVKPHTSAASPTPDSDATHWLYKQPSNRMSPFDEYIFTKARRAGSLKYVLTPPFFNGFAIYGAEADDVIVTIKDEVGGGDLVPPQTTEMWEQAFGLWEYLYGNLQKTTKLTRDGLPIRPAAELIIELIRNSEDVDAELGMLSVGQWRTLLSPITDVGGTQFGVEVTPKSYSYYKRNETTGEYVRRRGRQAKVINASVVIDAAQAPAVDRLLAAILDIPVAIEASNLPRYGHISTFGFVTGSVVSVDWPTARVNIKVDGNV